MREIFATTLTELALHNPKITLVVGDFCFGLFDRLKIERPKQYLNFGTCEQSMVSIAAGMAIGGLLPVVYTITPFLVDRAWEQIKLDVEQQNVKVILVGFADYPKDGPTHTETSLDYLSATWKNIKFYGPYDAAAARTALLSAVTDSKPSFIRLRNAPKQQPREWPAEGRDA